MASSSGDPHSLPSFDNLTSNASVLYLPPLLSSLPENVPPHDLPSLYPPLLTETRLPDIDPVSLSLHKALHYFKPLSSHYANTPYSDAFNWPELVLPADEEREWFCVVFRSKRAPGSESGRKSSFGFPVPSLIVFSLALYEADKYAHREAILNGGVRTIIPVNNRLLSIS